MNKYQVWVDVSYRGFVEVEADDAAAAVQFVEDNCNVDDLEVDHESVYAEIRQVPDLI